MEGLEYRALYKNPTIQYLFNSDITEYDMKSAGLSIIKEFKLLPQNQIDILDNCDKVTRNIHIGLIQKDNSEFKAKLEDGFVEMRRRFIENNSLTTDDIISIKKDAFFTRSSCYNNNVGEHVSFVTKNKYSSYVRLGNIELYYSERNGIDIKGLGDMVIEKHKDYLIEFLKGYFRTCESNPKGTLRFLRTFIDDYIERNLDVNFYRTFDYRSIIFLNDESIESVADWSNDSLDVVDISFNYFNVLMKLVEISI